MARRGERSWPGALWRAVAGGPERRARRLARDAATVIHNARATYRGELVRGIASRTGELRDEAARRCTTPAVARQHLSRLRALHREARRAGDQVDLTALTLAIIDLEASALDEPGRAARETVAAFLAAHEKPPP